jgi:hypothetical protein
MRRLYLVPKSVWFAGVHAGLYHPTVGSHYLDIAVGDAVTSHPQVAQRFVDSGHDLSTIPAARKAFAQDDGAGTSMVLVSTDFSSEGTEDLWHAHPAVAILPHPTFEGNDPIRKHLGSATKHIQAHHLAALAAHPTLGYLPGDTVLDLARKAAAIHPQVKLRHIL